MDKRVKEFRRAVREANQGRSRMGYRYPEKLRQVAVAYSVERVAEGEPLQEVAQRLGVSAMSLSRWGEERVSARLRPVEVSLEREVRATGPAAGGYVLVTPRGWRVEGLDLEGVLALLGRVG